MPTTDAASVNGQADASPAIRKALAYVTHRGRLLVFLQPDFPREPEQVPGGTVEAGESFADAVLREAAEETGIEGLTLQSTLGESTFVATTADGEQTIRRCFFHLAAPDDVPEYWEHVEQTPHDGSDPIRFEFFWLALSEPIRLSLEQDVFVSKLRQRMGIAEPTVGDADDAGSHADD